MGNKCLLALGLGASVSLRDDHWCREGSPAPLKYFLLSEGAGQDGSQEDFIKKALLRVRTGSRPPDTVCSIHNRKVDLNIWLDMPAAVVTHKRVSFFAVMVWYSEFY